MPRVFHPIRYIDIEASAPHRENTAYRVSVGLEYWDDADPKHVIKVQMVYDGRVSGRKSPSYPLEADDFERVMEAAESLKKGEGTKGRGLIQPAGGDIL